MPERSSSRSTIWTESRLKSAFHNRVHSNPDSSPAACLFAMRDRTEAECVAEEIEERLGGVPRFDGDRAAVNLEVVSWHDDAPWLFYFFSEADSIAWRA